ncbi:type II secretory pathway family, partial [Micromonas commoda]
LGGLRRRNAGSRVSGSSGGAVNSMSMLRYYADDSPGLKITPVVVLLMSVCFIAFVTVLHAVAKIYQFRSS